MSADVVVLDYEMSNLRSAVKALERLGATVRVIRGPEAVGAADAVVLPGVGHFGEAMRRIRGQGLDEAVAGRGGPRGARAGHLPGHAAAVRARARRRPASPASACCPGRSGACGPTASCPHIGWSRVAWSPESGLGPGPGEGGDSTYYFVHTFGCEPDDPALVLGRADHGVAFCAAAGRPGVQGVQFHPEKSSAAGLGLLGRWLAGVRAARPAAA